MDMGEYREWSIGTTKILVWYELDIWKIRFKNRIYFLPLISNEDNHSINNFESKISQKFTNPDVYLDSNDHKYRGEERLVRGCLSKVGVAYFGENECKVLDDIPTDV
jgi:hypothetical protein